MSELPESWLATKLGDVLDYGATIKTEPNEIPDDAWILELEDIEKDSSKLIRRFTFSERRSKSTKNGFSKGDVLYGKLRPYLNKVILADASGYCTTEIVPIRPPEITDSRFIFYWLKHPAFIGYATEVSHGLNMPRLGTDAGRNAPFVLAPLPEQKRIADKLDALLARVDACRERLDRVPGILKRFRQSVLTAATSGELTREWRDERSAAKPARRLPFDDDALSIPSSWLDATLGELLDPDRPLCYGVVQPGHEHLNGPLLVRVQDLEDGTIAVRNLRTVSPSVDSEYRRSRVAAGDVLISVVGTIGRVAVVPEKFQGNIARAVARLACGPSLRSQWLRFWLESEVVQWWLLRSSREVARKTLNLSELATTRVAIPSLEEQDEIISRTSNLFALAERIERRVKAVRSGIDQTTPSILAKAFRGELVPQDPNEVPASTLLARHRAHPVSMGTAGKLRQGAARGPHTKAKAVTNMLTRKDVTPTHLTTILKDRGSLTAEALWIASQLEIDDFYDQLKEEEARGLLRESRSDSPTGPRILEAAA